jgi:hypothetical protein
LNQVKHFGDTPADDATHGITIYEEYFELSDTIKSNSRTVTGIFEVFGNVGGLIQSMALIVAFFLNPYSEMCLKMDTISHLCLYSDAKNKISHIKFTVYDKVIFYFKLFCISNKSKQDEIMNKGSDIIDQEFDIINIIL